MELARFKLIVDALEGQTAILVQKDEFLYVRQVTLLGAELHGNSIIARAAPVETPGLLPARETLYFESSWADFTVSMSSWISNDNRWQLFHDHGVVDRVISLAM